MEDKIILIILLAVVGLILLYLIKAKKAGKKCIGCPYANDCASKGKSNCSCNHENSEE